jgi:hypothetical protein
MIYTTGIRGAHPILEDAELELGLGFNQVSYFQMLMTKEGFFVRGAIAVGELYMDDIEVFGAGLMDAYEAERSLARDPRIVHAASAQHAVNRHLAYYGQGSDAPQNRELLLDNDGQYF